MIRCIKCNCSVMDRPLSRTGPFGEDPEWMCMPCIEKHEPELAKNIKEDRLIDNELASIVATILL